MGWNTQLCSLVQNSPPHLIMMTRVIRTSWGNTNNDITLPQSMLLDGQPWDLGLVP